MNKTKQWEKIRRELKNEFQELGITSCEIRFDGCWVNNALSFAHLDKRRHLTADELRIVVLCCIPCHSIIEAWPREKMKSFLEKIIIERR